MKKLFAVLLAALLLAACAPAEPSSAQAASKAQAPAAAASAAPERAPLAGSASAQEAEEPPLPVVESLAPGAFLGQTVQASQGFEPYVELYADGTCIYVANVYQGLSLYLGTWTYADNRLKIDAKDALENVCPMVFTVLDEDTLRLEEGGDGLPCETFVRGSLEGHDAMQK